jgi:predicted aldo/keto reductase-like oxidoreductase
MVEYAKMRYNLLGNGSHWFPGQKADQIERLNLEPYLVNSPHADKIPDLLTQADRLLGGTALQRLSQS